MMSYVCDRFSIILFRPSHHHLMTNLTISKYTGFFSEAYGTSKCSPWVETFLLLRDRSLYSPPLGVSALFFACACALHHTHLAHDSGLTSTGPGPTVAQEQDVSFS